MVVRKRLSIADYNNGGILKLNMFFLAGRLGLSGWVRNFNTNLLLAEIQGEEGVINNYVERLVQAYGVRKEYLNCKRVMMDKTDDGSVKIG